MNYRWMALAACLLSVTAAAEDEFRMEVVDTFVITGRSVVVTGKIETGTVNKGDVLCLRSAESGAEREITVGGIERFRKLLESASAGEHVGLLLDELEKGDAAKGDVLLADC